MIYCAAIQNNYNAIEIGLFRSTQLIDTAIIPKAYASKDIIHMFNDLLLRNNTTLKDLTFIGVNQGPGPFTTLRVVIASVNGINFATGLPLVGIDGLTALLNEHQDTTYPCTIALLNAFNNDVYFGIHDNHIIRTGCMPIEALLQELKHQYPHQKVRFIGNGVALHIKTINNIFDAYAIIPDPLPEFCSISYLGLTGLHQWQEGVRITEQVMPLYLKNIKSGTE